MAEDASNDDDSDTDLHYYDQSQTIWKRFIRKIKYWFYDRVGDDWVFLLFLGVMGALLAFALENSTTKLFELRAYMIDSTEIKVVQFFIWIIYYVVFVMLSVFFTHFVSKQAAGSGIPEVKTILKGVHLPEYLTLRTLLAKFIGLIFAVGSGLPIGQEGPFVHMTAILSSTLMRLPIFRRIGRNEARRLQMLAAAAAVGVSCNFGAPVGGVLFSIEVTATYFAVSNYWRYFFSAVCGAFLFRLLAVFDAKERTITALFTTRFVDFPFDVEEVVAFSLIGVLCGFFGALFILVFRRMMRFRQKGLRGIKYLNKSQFVYPVIVALISGVIMFPGALPYMGLTTKESISDLFSEIPLEQNDVWNSPNLYVSLVAFIVVNFFLTAVSITLPLPAGVFIPIFAVGAAFGRVIGEIMRDIYPLGIDGRNVTSIVPGGYALVGAAALTGSVTHTISTSVIVFELTGQMHHILPVMIAVVVAVAICTALVPSIYDSIVEIKHLPYLPELRHFRSYSMSASGIMKTQLHYVSQSTTYGDVEQLLSESSDTMFPYVDRPDSLLLMGVVQRSVLEKLFVRRMNNISTAEPGDDIVNNIDVSSRPLCNAILLPTPNEISDEEGCCSDVNIDSDENDVSNANTPRIISNNGSTKIRRTFSSSDKPSSCAESEDRSSFTLTPSKILRTIRNRIDEFSRYGDGISSSQVITFDPDSSDVQSIAEKSQRQKLLASTLHLQPSQIESAPFQIIGNTSMSKIHGLFMLLGLPLAYVTSLGRLVGVITIAELRNAILKSSERAHRRRLRHRHDTGDSSMSTVLLKEEDNEELTQAEPIDTVEELELVELHAVDSLTD